MDSAEYQLTTCHMSMIYDKTKNPNYVYELYFLCPSERKKMDTKKALTAMLERTRKTSIVTHKQFTAIKLGKKISLENIYMQNSSQMESTSMMFYVSDNSLAIIMQKPSDTFMEYLKNFLHDKKTHVKEVAGLGLFLTNKPIDQN